MLELDEPARPKVSQVMSHDTSIGTAIRAARFSRGLTQDNLAARLEVTRATIASYETGRRKIPAGTLIQIAHLCGKPLSFFDAHSSPEPAPPQPRAGAGLADPQQAGIDAVVNTLHAHPEFTPFVLEFLETLIQERKLYALCPRQPGDCPE